MGAVNLLLLQPNMITFFFFFQSYQGVFGAGKGVREEVVVGETISIYICT